VHNVNMNVDARGTEAFWASLEAFFVSSSESSANSLMTTSLQHCCEGSRGQRRWADLESGNVPG
jgi:hypothetical protein